MYVAAQHIFQGSSGLPEDRFVNTTHWHVDDQSFDHESWHITIANRLKDFYGQVHAPGTQTLTSLLSPVILDTAEIRTYSLADPIPREPVITQYELGSRGTGGGLPSEVAVCASFYAGRNLPRRRGRLYFGPLAVAAMTNSGGVTPYPSNAVRNALLGACEWMANENTTLFWWGVYSKVNGAAAPITAGWVDNAFDTQRRRGEAPTERSTWERID